MQRGWMVRGDGLSQHGRETQDGEVKRQLFNEGDMKQGDQRTKGQGRGKQGSYAVIKSHKSDK